MLLSALKGVCVCVALTCPRMILGHMSLPHPQTSTEESKQEKKAETSQAKKPKVKTKTVELPIEQKPEGQLSNETLNLFVENEVMHTHKLHVPSVPWCVVLTKQL